MNRDLIKELRERQLEVQRFIEKELQSNRSKYNINDLFILMRVLRTVNDGIAELGTVCYMQKNEELVRHPDYTAELFNMDETLHKTLVFIKRHIDFVFNPSDYMDEFIKGDNIVNLKHLYIAYNIVFMGRLVLERIERIENKDIEDSDYTWYTLEVLLKKVYNAALLNFVGSNTFESIDTEEFYVIEGRVINKDYKEDFGWSRQTTELIVLLFRELGIEYRG